MRKLLLAVIFALLLPHFASASNQTNFTVVGSSAPFSIAHEDDEIVIEPLQALINHPQGILSEKSFTVRISAPQALLAFDVEGGVITYSSKGISIEVKHGPITLQDPHIRIKLHKPVINFVSTESLQGIHDAYSAIPAGGHWIVAADYCGKNFGINIELLGEKNSYGSSTTKYDVECAADMVVRIAPDALAPVENGQIAFLDRTLLTGYLYALRSEGINARVEVSEPQIDHTEKPKKNALLKQSGAKYLLLLGDGTATGFRDLPGYSQRAMLTPALRAQAKWDEVGDFIFVDDAMLDAGPKPAIAVGRIPGGRKEIEAYLSRPRTVIRSGATPTIFYDSCGTPDPNECFLKDNADKLSKTYTGKNCDESGICKKAPEICVSVYDPSVGLRRACKEQDQLQTTSPVIYFVTHGTPDVFSGRSPIMLSNGTNGSLEYTIAGKTASGEYFPKIPQGSIVFAGGCGNGKTGGAIGRLAISRGASNFIGATRIIWTLEIGGAPPLETTQLIALRTLQEC
ncbi:MAG TPA: hypothetical protein VGQ00_00880, partial [Candidatus Norongarragalinales archaeon]|nr:hypothetical protein [Candidatus Norongarragalinales archaeon]